MENHFPGNRKQPQTPARQPGEEDRACRPQLDVLIAEDDESAFIQIRETLETAGYRTTCLRVATMEALKQALDARHWDVVIANYTLAAMDLFAALATVRQLQPDLPFVIIAEGLGEEMERESAISAMRAGANDFIQKKSHLPRLIPIIQRELLAAKARDATHQAMEARGQAVTHFNRLAESIPECVWVLDLDAGKMSFVSAAYEKIWGKSVQDLLDDRKDWLRHIHPDDQHRMKLARNAAKLGGLDEEFRVLRPDGGIRWLHLTTFPIQDSTNHIVSIGGVASDITSFIDQRDALRATLVEQEHRVDVQRVILDALPANIALLDENGRIVETNATWRKTLEANPSTEYILGADYLAACETVSRRNQSEKADETAHFVAAVRGILAGGNEPTTRIYPVHTEHEQRWYRITVAPLHTHARRGAVVMYVEITESMLAEQRMLQLSNYDSLTMLPNRLLFRDRLASALALARRSQHSVAVCFLDLDRFKAINESLGHQVGDQLLLEVASRLVACVRDSDTVARFGGDEFALILPGLAHPQDTTDVAERIIQSLSNACSIAGHELFITASIGVALFPEDGDDVDTLQRNADTAMYRAKEEGRNNFQFFTAEMNANAMETMKLESDLRHAINNDEFLLYYQPKASCITGEIVGFEALLRWKHPRHGMVSPAEFVPLLEETGLIVSVGAWVLHTACAQAKAWQNEGFGNLSIAVNVSGKQMNSNSHLCETVQAALDASGLSPAQLEIELTESQLMHDAEGIIATLRHIKEMGVNIAVDDFGTGYSSLAYLKRFPLDSLKVDRAFVQDITADPNDVSITRAIITLAHSFNLQVVAEGVETEGQLSLLIANQCDVIQGYYFSRPLPVAEISVMLRENHKLADKFLRIKQQTHRTLLFVGCDAATIEHTRRCLDHQNITLLDARDVTQGCELIANHRANMVITTEQPGDTCGLEFLQRVKALYPETMRLLLTQNLPAQDIAEAVASGLVHKAIAAPWRGLPADIVESFQHHAIIDENQQLQNKLDATNHELSQANAQLQNLLTTRTAEIGRNDTVLDVSREILHNLPWPVIGIDDSGMIAFTNSAADTLLAQQPPLLAMPASLVLPAALAAALAHPEHTQTTTATTTATTTTNMDIYGQRYRLHLHPMGVRSRSTGTLAVLFPNNPT